MKAFLAVLLVPLILVSGLLPGFGLDQSAKWVELAHHYREHKAEDHTLGFAEFLFLHYATDSEHQKHPNHGHHNLPATGHAPSVYPPVPLRLPALPGTLTTLRFAKSVFTRPADLYSFATGQALIQPPRR